MSSKGLTLVEPQGGLLPDFKNLHVRHPWPGKFPDVEDEEADEPEGDQGEDDDEDDDDDEEGDGQEGDDNRPSS